jgi:sugar lactone lactonase YvrE
MRSDPHGCWRRLQTLTLLLAATAACSGGGATAPGSKTGGGTGGGALNDSIGGPPSGIDLRYPGYMVFDTARSIWMTFQNSSLTSGFVAKYTLAQQQKGGVVAPAMVISGFQNPQGLTFDRGGNLWVVDQHASQLLEFTTAQLAQGGSPSPATSLSTAGLNGSDYSYVPQELSFDPQGNVWVSAAIGTRGPSASEDSLPDMEVAEFAVADLAASGAPTPVTTLKQIGFFPGGYGPGLAFDTAGNLWTANTNIPSSLTEFAGGTLVPGSNPAPAITITGTSGSLDHVSGVEIDVKDNLIASIGVGASVEKQKLLVYTPHQLTATGSPTPSCSYSPPNAEGIFHFSDDEQFLQQMHVDPRSPEVQPFTLDIDNGSSALPWFFKILGNMATCHGIYEPP